MIQTGTASRLQLQGRSALAGPLANLPLGVGPADEGLARLQVGAAQLGQPGLAVDQLHGGLLQLAQERLHPAGQGPLVEAGAAIQLVGQLPPLPGVLDVVGGEGRAVRAPAPLDHGGPGRRGGAQLLQQLAPPLQRRHPLPHLVQAAQLAPVAVRIQIRQRAPQGPAHRRLERLQLLGGALDAAKGVEASHRLQAALDGAAQGPRDDGQIGLEGGGGRRGGDLVGAELVPVEPQRLHLLGDLPPALRPQQQEALELLHVIGQGRLGRIGQGLEGGQPRDRRLSGPALAQLGPALGDLGLALQGLELGGVAGGLAVGAATLQDRLPARAEQHRHAAQAAALGDVGAQLHQHLLHLPAGQAGVDGGGVLDEQRTGLLPAGGRALDLLAELSPELLVGAAAATGRHHLALPGGQRRDLADQLIDGAPQGLQRRRLRQIGDRAPEALAGRALGRLDELDLAVEVVGRGEIGQRRQPRRQIGLAVGGDGVVGLVEIAQLHLADRQRRAQRHRPRQPAQPIGLALDEAGGLGGGHVLAGQHDGQVLAVADGAQLLGHALDLGL